MAFEGGDNPSDTTVNTGNLGIHESVSASLFQVPDQQKNIIRTAEEPELHTPGREYGPDDALELIRQRSLLPRSSPLGQHIDQILEQIRIMGTPPIGS